MPRFLVTGGAGFIGSNLADGLAADPGNSVTAVDNMLTGKKQNLSQKPNLKFIKADVNNFNDISSVFYSGDYDYVYHYSAVVGVKRTLENPVLVLRDIDGIKNILELSKNTDVKRVLYASSSEVYGEPVELPQHEETTPLNSRLPYAVVKNIGECFLRSYKLEYGLDFTIFRFFNTYGPRQSTDFVMSKFLNAALSGKDITIYSDGSQTRTFCFVSDNVEATTKAIKDRSTIDEVVNIGNDNEITIKELAQKIIKKTKSKSKVVHLPPLKEGDMTRRQPDAAKMKKLLGRPLTSLDEGIEKLIEYRKHLA
ncbi:GDP-mannose 4,6-dehydratase [Candidatus Saccharibacteria bacterium]|nr:GDP-mannose 4,6-dehydratase [Candidatus Saccharibacteria bacterium]